jgi:hypothetical protein
MVFVGYEEGAKAYRCYNPVSKRISITRDVLFQENHPWDWNQHSTEPERLEEFTVIYGDEQFSETVAKHRSPTAEPEGVHRSPS